MTDAEAAAAPDKQYLTELHSGGRTYHVYVYRCARGRGRQQRQGLGGGAGQGRRGGAAQPSCCAVGRW